MKFQLERIALFSDAVFAIAITLMMIEIKAPHLEHGISFAHAVETFAGLLPIFGGTVLSFFLIGTFWKKHHQLMKYMSAYNPKVLTLNISLLLFIAFIPFSTMFVFENFESHSPLPLVVYSLNYIMATIFNYRLFEYVLNPKNGMCTENHNEDARILKREAIFHVGVYLLVIALAFVNPDFAACAFALLAFEDKWSRRGKGSKQTKEITNEEPSFASEK